MRPLRRRRPSGRRNFRGALKGFIVADRQRRQEEYEAQCEEQRLRREREEVERQNNQSLEETRGQITRLDEQLADLHSQKHQLTVQLKKVLNEDETRKKQAKENELFAMQQAAASVASGPVFLPPLRLQHHQLLQKVRFANFVNSPAPTNASSVFSPRPAPSQRSGEGVPRRPISTRRTTRAPPTMPSRVSQALIVPCWPIGHCTVNAAKGRETRLLSHTKHSHSSSNFSDSNRKAVNPILSETHFQFAFSISLLMILS